MNVFPTFENYIDQFRIFIEKISKDGTLIYYDGDNEVKNLAANSDVSLKKIPYNIHGHFQNKKGFFAATHNRVVPLKIFGEHNMQNLSAAKEACMAAGISEDQFYEAIQSFEGTSRRLQKLSESEKGVVYLDFAHSPSKVQATVDAISARYPGRDVVACLELHTYSSLSDNFLPLYRHTMAKATEALVYFNPHSFEIKKLPPISGKSVLEAFESKNVRVFDDSQELKSYIKTLKYQNPVFLFMSSGDFDGFDFKSVV